MMTVFDLETTGVDPWNDRIVSIYLNDGIKRFHSLVNPGIPIPREATKIHGITDEMVALAPTFKTLAPLICTMTRYRTLVGYNSRRFDTIMLHQEFERANLVAPYQLETVSEIDVLAVWRSFETQNLSSAVRRWLNREHEGAHGADADAEATREVLDAIVKYYGLSLEECEARTAEVSRSSYLKLVDGHWTFAFGKYRGSKCDSHLDYLQWMLESGFDQETKRIVRHILGVAP